MKRVAAIAALLLACAVPGWAQAPTRPTQPAPDKSAQEQKAQVKEAAASPARGVDYYISNKPGSGDGTKANPFGMADLPGRDAKLTKALTVLKPGDTLWFMGGEYRFETATGSNKPYIRAPGKGGEPGREISFRAMPGEKVVLNKLDPWGQSIIGTASEDQSHVRIEGFVLRGKSQRLVRLVGKVELAYCELIADFSDPKVQGSNPAAIYPRNGDGSWVHHNIIRGNEEGKPDHGHGMEVYWSENMVVEDNWIYGLQNGLYDKESGLDNIYRRNYVHGNRFYAFLGNNQGMDMKVQIYDNVLVGNVSLGIYVDGTDLHDNLILDDALAGAQSGVVKNQSIWNNIVISKDGKPLMSYRDGRFFQAEGPKKNLDYMDYNLYTAHPSYMFGGNPKKEIGGEKREEFTLAKMRQLGFEKNSQVVGGPLEIFEDEKSYKLRGKWAKAGKDGTMPGPDDIASIMDTTRYGPGARPKVNPVRDWPEQTMQRNRPTRVLPPK